ncbi:spore germination protein (amino acid permease) [Paenibacillus sp. yr247]|uniref:GerAB/ArcD/ProY family transporter n=1 Tax=Paenibacillus sp. yr247 TaxID=1761880 RepID=UPI00088F2CB4|nr:GerAB/ArcD/ProY family transporter [Paenibacillus sp. yr247]SDO77508.1 spore germination protein (amino acid permease) [Paenibacillus sp. yr247]
MGSAVSDKFTISPFLLYFPLYVSIVDIGMMSFQREVVNDAGYDAWISVLITGISIQIIVWMMYKILSSQNQTNASILSINCAYFGKMIGNGLNLAIILYFILGAFVTYRTYIEVINVWIFPAMQMLPLSLLILVVIYYTVSGGFRTVTGICFWGAISIFLFIVPVAIMLTPYLHPQNLLPLFNHTAAQVVESSKSMVQQYLGVEVLLVVYPFIQLQAKSQKWAQLAVLTSTMLYLLVLFVTFMYFSQGQLLKTIWPTLNMISILQFPLMQRLEYLVISVWFIKMLSNISINLWAACHSLKLSLRTKPRISLLIFLVLFVIMQLLVKDRNSIDAVAKVYANIGGYLIYIYIPILFIITLVRKKLKLTKQGQPTTSQ